MTPAELLRLARDSVTPPDADGLLESVRILQAAPVGPASWDVLFASPVGPGRCASSTGTGAVLKIVDLVAGGRRSDGGWSRRLRDALTSPPSPALHDDRDLFDLMAAASGRLRYPCDPVLAERLTQDVHALIAAVPEDEERHLRAEDARDTARKRLRNALRSAVSVLPADEVRSALDEALVESVMEDDAGL